MKEEVREIEVSRIVDFPNHPFKILNDDNYKELEESIRENGVLVPITIRINSNGKFEMISGHRRKKICERNGIERIPCIVKNLSDEEAIIQMVDSNLQRDKILPSEKAFAYKLKMDALSHQGKSYGHEVHKSRDVIGEECGRQVQRYIRLTYLIPELLKLVDDTVLKDKRSNLTMGIKPAVELSYLSNEEQKMIYNEIIYIEATPSYVQAAELRKLSKSRRLDEKEITNILLEPKPNQQSKISFNENRLRSVLPRDIKDYKIEDFVINAIEYYLKEYEN